MPADILSFPKPDPQEPEGIALKEFQQSEAYPLIRSLSIDDAIAQAYLHGRLGALKAVVRLWAEKVRA